MTQSEQWEKELKAAGWKPSAVHPHAPAWYAPDGRIYPGPFYAWQVMKNSNATVTQLSNTN